MDDLSLKLCDIQGRLFELSVDKGFNSEIFIKEFMNSDIAEYLDSSFNFYQWAGEQYILEDLNDRYKLIIDNKAYSKETMYWIGYIYRYWHFYTSESSKDIYKQAKAKTMNSNYLLFHTLANELAIDNLKEIYRQKHTK